MHLIIIFGLLIYLEIIELDFCNLNYNIKKRIAERGFEDCELKSNNETIYEISISKSYNSINSVCE